MMKNIFETTDMPLIAALCCEGYTISDIDKSNPSKVIFSIDRDERLDQVLKLFWSHSLGVEPMAYFACLKEIKSRIYNN